jgi:hypothetical protein
MTSTARGDDTARLHCLLRLHPTEAPHHLIPISRRFALYVEHDDKPDAAKNHLPLKRVCFLAQKS